MNLFLLLVVALIVPMVASDGIDPVKGAPVDFGIVVRDGTTCGDAQSMQAVEGWFLRYLGVNFAPVSYSFGTVLDPERRELSGNDEQMNEEQDRKLQGGSGVCNSSYCLYYPEVCYLIGCPLTRRLRGRRLTTSSGTTVTVEDVLSTNTTSDAIAMAPYSQPLNDEYFHPETGVYIGKFYSADATICNPSDLTLLLFFGDDNR